MGGEAAVFTSSGDVRGVRRLFVRFGGCLRLRGRCAGLRIARGLSGLLSALLLILLIIVLNMIILFRLSFALICVLTPLMNKLVVDFTLVAYFRVLLVILLILFHGGLVVSPAMGLVTRLFLSGWFRVFVSGAAGAAPIALRDVTRGGTVLLRRVQLRGRVVAKLARRVFTPLRPTAGGTGTVVETFGANVTIFSNVMLKMGMVGGFEGVFKEGE